MALLRRFEAARDALGAAAGLAVAGAALVTVPAVMTAGLVGETARAGARIARAAAGATATVAEGRCTSRGTSLALGARTVGTVVTGSDPMPDGHVRSLGGRGPRAWSSRRSRGTRAGSGLSTVTSRSRSPPRPPRSSPRSAARCAGTSSASTGVQWATVNGVVGRVLVAIDDRRVSVEDVVGVVTAIEQARGGRKVFPHRADHPADLEPFLAAVLTAAVDTAAVGRRRRGEGAADPGGQPARHADHGAARLAAVAQGRHRVADRSDRHRPALLRHQCAPARDDPEPDGPGDQRGRGAPAGGRDACPPAGVAAPGAGAVPPRAGGRRLRAARRRPATGPRRSRPGRSRPTAPRLGPVALGGALGTAAAHLAPRPLGGPAQGAHPEGRRPRPGGVRGLARRAHVPPGRPAHGRLGLPPPRPDRHRVVDGDALCSGPPVVIEARGEADGWDDAAVWSAAVPPARRRRRRPEDAGAGNGGAAAPPGTAPRVGGRAGRRAPHAARGPPPGRASSPSPPELDPHAEALLAAADRGRPPAGPHRARRHRRDRRRRRRGAARRTSRCSTPSGGCRPTAAGCWWSPPPTGPRSWPPTSPSPRYARAARRPGAPTSSPRPGWSTPAGSSTPPRVARAVSRRAVTTAITGNVLGGLLAAVGSARYGQRKATTPGQVRDGQHDRRRHLDGGAHRPPPGARADRAHRRGTRSTPTTSSAGSRELPDEPEAEQPALPAPVRAAGAELPVVRVAGPLRSARSPPSCPTP